MAKAFNLPVSEFRDIVGGVRWLDLARIGIFWDGRKAGNLVSQFRRG